MRKLTKVVSALLSVTMIFSILTVAPFAVSAVETDEAIPAYVSYQAKRYSAPSSIFSDASTSYASIQYNKMKSSESVISGVEIWEAAHIATSPSYSLESGLITKKDMYKLAIFDMLNVTESDTFAYNLLNITQDSRMSYIFSVTKTLCDPNDIKINELKNFEVNAEYLNYLKESAKVAKALDVVDKISMFADGCSNLYDAVNTMASYQAIADMKNGTKEILTAIADDTSNPSDLQQAASECVDCFNEGFEHILNTIIDGSNPYVNATLETIFSNAFDYAWDELISAIPGGKVVMTAAKGMRVLSNSIFKMDDTCRIYYQFEADVMLENAIRKVMNNSKDDYLQDKNQYKAVAYMRAVEMYKRIVLQGYDYGIEMLTIKASAPATLWFDWLNHDYSECMEEIKGVEYSKSICQTNYENFEEWVYSDYINAYCHDYNETINGFNNQQTIYTDSVAFSQIKDINVGDSGYIYDYIQKSCQPENSVEYKKCYFTADNKDIFTIDKLGSFVAESAGQVTLTYDQGGELEKSITITIGSTPTDNKHDYYSDFKYSTYYNYSNHRTEATITGYTGSQTNLIIPYSIDGCIVTHISDRAFTGCSSLTNVTIPDSVTSIGMDAFRWTSLTNVTIPDSVTSIGHSAFSGCSSLISITIPDSVTSINAFAFSDCSSLTSIIIPDSVTYISLGAFEDCSSLTSVNIPDSVTSIEQQAFLGCSSLISITIPDSVTSIGIDTFMGCTSLTEIYVDKNSTNYSSIDGVLFDKNIKTIVFFPAGKQNKNYVIPNSVKSIGRSAFACCTNLTSITIPNSVTSIGNYAFYYCSSLTNVTIPDSITSIDYGAFEGCSSLTNIKIPDSVTNIGNSTFEGCSSLTSINIPNSVTSIGNSTFEGCSSLTSINILNNVTSIGDRAFKNCTNLSTITIGNGVISIDYSAFEGCSSLTSINIPNSVTSIGDRTFKNCTNLKSITIGNGVISIDYSTFEGCSSLTSIIIPDGVKSIGNSAFYECTTLESIIIPDSVTEIGGSAFSHCKNLASINIPDSVTSIGNYAFSNCSSLTSINIPDSVTNIGEAAFRDCTNLISITISNSVTDIGKATFEYCYSLASINIPNGVTSIGNRAFSECSSITSITIPDSITSIGNSAFSGCSRLTSVNIPDSVISIGDSVFYGCSSLTSINIPDSVTIIGNYAFQDCSSLKSINIPDGITSIGNYAFQDCSNLTNINIPDSVTNIGDHAFNSWNDDLSDVLFKGSKEQWDSINIGEYNFRNAAIHYNSKFIKTVVPDCTNRGYDLYSCSECEGGVKVNYTNALGHNFINGICERCGKDELDCIESLHPYENNTDEKWTIHKNNAKRIAVIFSDKTETESGYDYIYIYNKDNEEIGRYSGTELSGKRVIVHGDTATIRLTSDSSSTLYGFSISEIIPYYDECNHTETELRNSKAETCGEDGYTGDLVCTECELIIEKGKNIPATGEHAMDSTVYEPSCGDQGYTYHYCKNCDYSYRDEFTDATGNHSIVTVVHEPTCGSKGYTYYYCEDCSYSYEDDYVDATGNHKFENGICKVCGHLDVDCLDQFNANDTKNIEINNPGEYKYFKFTPNKNGTLNFYSTGSCDTYGYLYDSQMNELTYNDDASEDYNFNISYSVIAGEIYILGCRLYNSSNCGIFDVVVNFEPDMPSALIGDVNNDGIVSIADATTLQKYLANIVDFDDKQLAVADTNGDGSVSIADATQIQKYLANIIPSLG